MAKRVIHELMPKFTEKVFGCLLSSLTQLQSKRSLIWWRTVGCSIRCCLQSSSHLHFVRHRSCREDRCFKFEKQSKGLDERLLQAAVQSKEVEVGK